MKNNPFFVAIASFFASIASLFQFVVIFAICGALLVAAAWMHNSVITAGSFNDAQEQIETLNSLKVDVLGNQYSVFYNQDQYVFFSMYEEDATSYLQDSDSYNEDVAAKLNEMLASGAISQETFDKISNLREQQTQAFNNVKAAYEAGVYSDDNPGPFLDVYQANITASNKVWDALESEAARATASRNEAIKDFPYEISAAVRLILICMAISMLVALWSYRRINSLVGPLQGLHDGINAVGADTFRPEIVKGARRYGGQIGRMARQIENLNKTIENRDQGLKKQVADLRQELILSRRRRLKLIRKPETQNLEEARHESH